jgi:anaerobic ribonucleoside-triphosphate reductase activating protein
MTGSIRVHKIAESSLVNGPGYRFVLWVQGCPFNCPGCFNLAAQEFSGGCDFPSDQLLDSIRKENIQGITISGGEPFMQAEALSSLLKECRSCGLNTLVYTGFSFNDLKRDAIPNARLLLEQIDLLIDGPYKKDIPFDGEWTGSGNQKVIALSGKGIAMKKQRRMRLVEQEYIISPSGQLIHTGI